MDTPLLWHIPLSHFNEKARWALDFKGIAHRRQVLGPDYLVRAWRATGQGKLPILFLDGGAISDSTRIIAALMQTEHAQTADERTAQAANANSVDVIGSDIANGVDFLCQPAKSGIDAIITNPPCALAQSSLSAP
jgi:glutathione S-transferase